MEILIITGPPYSGKGTQCLALKNILGFKHISTGDRCRLEKRNNSYIGRILSKYETLGELVPDHIMRKLLNRILDENVNERGLILDGYPRTINQVNYLLKLVKLKVISINKVFQIEVEKKELIKRGIHRATKSNRQDDQDPRIRERRIEIYEKMIKPSIEHMKTKLNVFTCYSDGTKEELTQKIIVEL